MATSNKNCSNDKVIWMQITAGQGPRECGWVVGRLTRKVMEAASSASIDADIVESLAFDKPMRNQDLIEPDAYLSVLLRLNGAGAHSFASTWAGSIKWQGESPYRPKHKRLNWFVGVEIVSVAPARDIDLSALSKEVEFESMRSSGPGGQHVNKTNSAIRLTHRPSGITVRVDTDRSQHRNRQLALERLHVLLETGSKETEKAQVHDRWLNHYQVTRGNPTRTFYGQEFIEK